MSFLTIALLLISARLHTARKLLLKQAGEKYMAARLGSLRAVGAVIIFVGILTIAFLG